jgi:hypothetical protein
MTEKSPKKMSDENERVRLRERVMEICISIHSHFHHFYLVAFSLFSFSTFFHPFAASPAGDVDVTVEFCTNNFPATFFFDNLFVSTPCVLVISKTSENTPVD